jgi:hypothetical protein
MNSGIMPNRIRSSGASAAHHLLGRQRLLLLGGDRREAEAARGPCGAGRCASSPTNAPPQMKRMFDVLIWMYSWFGCLRPPCGGTLQVVPSRIFSSACCTPSPETSRVIETFSVLRPILSISSM